MGVGGGSSKNNFRGWLFPKPFFLPLPVSFPSVADAFSTAARPGSQRKSCFLLCVSSCSVSKHALGVGDGVCRQQVHVIADLGEGAGKAGTRVQNVLKHEHKPFEGSLPFGNWSHSGAALQKPCAKSCA